MDHRLVASPPKVETGGGFPQAAAVSLGMLRDRRPSEASLTPRCGTSRTKDNKMTRVALLSVAYLATLAAFTLAYVSLNF